MSTLTACFDDITECPICNDVLQTPKSLPCMHTFCLKCLQVYIDHRESEEFICPVCRGQFSIQNNNCDLLPTNFFMEKLLEASRTTNSPPRVCDATDCVMCSTLDTKTKAVSLCIECNMGFCVKCTEIHGKNCHQNGQVDNKKICEEHKREYELYCESCGELACLVCSVNKHNCHKLIVVEDAYDEVKGKISKCIDIINSKSTKYDEFKKAVNEKYSQIEVEIKAKANDLREIIEFDEKNILRSLKKHRDELYLCSINNNLMVQLDKLKDLANNTDKIRVILESVDACNIESKEDEIDGKSFSNMTKQLSNMKLLKNDNTYRTNMIGQIRIKSMQSESKEDEIDGKSSFNMSKQLSNMKLPKNDNTYRTNMIGQIRILKSVQSDISKKNKELKDSNGATSNISENNQSKNSTNNLTGNQISKRISNNVFRWLGVYEKMAKEKRHRSSRKSMFHKKVVSKKK